MGMKPGDRGEGVRMLQEKLNEFINDKRGTAGDTGLIGLEPDGTFGENTRVAVAEFQKARGMEPSGWVGCEMLGGLGLPKGLGADGVDTLNECE